MTKKTDGRIDAPTSPEGAAAAASNGLLSAWDRDELDLTKLTREQQLLFAVAALRQELGAGGFASYFSSGWSVLEPMTPEALRIVGESWTDAFLEAQAIADRLERDPAAMRDSAELKALDRRCHELESETAVSTQLDAWVGWNRDTIFRTKKALFGLL
jgi:hypothetical protein